MILLPLSVEKYVFSCWFPATAISSDLLYRSKSSIYLDSSLETPIRQPLLYKLLRLHVLNKNVIFCRLGTLLLTLYLV
jgi:hypothetical protein